MFCYPISHGRDKEIEKEIVYIVSKENPGSAHATAQKSNQEIITPSTKAWKNIWLDLKGKKGVDLEWVFKKALTGSI